MFLNRYLPYALAAIAIVAVGNWLGTIEDYYHSFYYYDFIMHFMGGLSMGLLFLWALNVSYLNRFKGLATAKRIVLLVLAIGILWEIFELTFDITNISDIGYVWDTTHDIIMDVVGAWVATRLIKK